MAKSVISGIPTFLGNWRFLCNFKIIDYTKKGVSVHSNPNLRPLYNRYFCHITILNWSQICKTIHQKVLLGDILFVGKFSIKFHIKAVKLYQHWK